MNQETNLDLKDLQFLLESLKGRLTKMPQKTKVDVAARLRAVGKTADEICDALRDEFTNALKGKPGSVAGELFKANVAHIPTTRLNQKLVRSDYPKVYDKCLETKDQARVTYEVK